MPFIVIRFMFFGIVVGAIYVLWLNYKSQNEVIEEEDPVERLEEAIQNLEIKIKVIEQKIPTIASCRETTLANINVQEKYHQEWLTKAEDAIQEGDENWGKECLKRALMARKQLQFLNRELDLFDQKIKQLEHSLEDHQYKLDTLMGKYQSVKVRMELAQTEQEMHEILAEVHSGKIFDMINDIENRVVEDELKFEAMKDLYPSNELSLDEVDELTVMEEFEKLKKNVG